MTYSKDGKVLEFKSTNTQEEPSLKKDSSALVNLLKNINREKNLEEVLQTTLGYFVASANIDQASFFIADENLDLYLYAHQERGYQKAQGELNISLQELDGVYKSVIIECVRRGQTVAVSSLFNPEQIQLEEDIDSTIQAVAAFPLFINGNLLGLFYLQSQTSPYAFTKEVQEVIEFACQQVGQGQNAKKKSNTIGHWSDVSYLLGQESVVRETLTELAVLKQEIKESERSIQKFTQNPLTKRFMATNDALSRKLEQGADISKIMDPSKLVGLYGKFSKIFQKDLSSLRSSLHSLTKVKMQIEDLERYFNEQEKKHVGSISVVRAVEDILTLKYETSIEAHKNYQSPIRLKVSRSKVYALVDTILQVIEESATKTGKNLVAIMTTEDDSKYYLKITTQGMHVSSENLAKRYPAVERACSIVKEWGGYMISKGKLTSGVSFVISLPK